ncbi:hypothetical protein BKA65DRAFT_547226 [Rhexocercosporidium sp. MPI-PUGE-AT-0058]|nr:hypothetical protein BKA65DRAFT_547226 [Rhexocercosporidium sp. MPI-PUGE-AT-0058]
MAAHGRKFSFLRLINNAIPNFARDDPNDVDLSSPQADALFRYQLALPQPRYLGEEAFSIAGIVGSKTLSRNIFKGLIKRGIISPASQNPIAENQVGREGGEVQMTVNTAGITKNLARQLASISMHAQRKSVGLLFFWEEECTMCMLLDWERDIRRVWGMDGVNGYGDLEIRLEAVGFEEGAYA